MTRPITTVLVVAIGMLAVGCSYVEPAFPNPRNPMADSGVRKLGIVFFAATETSSLDDAKMREINQIFYNEIQHFDDFEVEPAPTVYNLMLARQYTIPDDARRIADELGLDALLVGLITDYYPYEPPRVGVEFRLYPVEASHQVVIDPMAVKQFGVPYDTREEVNLEMTIARVIDSAHAGTRMRLKSYVTFRSPKDVPNAVDRHLMSMDDYMKFVSHQMILSMVHEARDRVEEARKRAVAKARAQRAAAREAAAAHRSGTTGTDVPRPY